MVMVMMNVLLRRRPLSNHNAGRRRSLDRRFPTPGERRSAVSAKAVGGGIYRAAFRTSLACVPSCGIFCGAFRCRCLNVVFDGSIAGQRLDSMKRRGDRFFAGLWPPEVVIHFDEEIIRG